MKHTLSVYVRNRSGVLSRVAGLFSGRGYNIDSLCVAETNEPGYSLMTIVVTGSDAIIEQINKQLNKLIDVVKVITHSGDEIVVRELMLVKINATAQTRSEIVQITNIFRGHIVDLSPKSLIVEIYGTNEKLMAALEMFAPFGIKDIVRTGSIAMTR